MSTVPSICPRCSTEFGCGIQTGACWCREMRMNDITRSALAQYYDGCLCRGCLEEIDAGRPQVPSVRAFLAGQLRRKAGRRS